jgi:hypothetical protein
MVLGRFAEAIAALTMAQLERKVGKINCQDVWGR